MCGGDPADTRNFDTEFTKLNVRDSNANSNEPDSLLDYDGFSFLDEEYRALRSHEQCDLRLSLGSCQGGDYSSNQQKILNDIDSCAVKGKESDIEGSVDDYSQLKDDGPINF